MSLQGKYYVLESGIRVQEDDLTHSQMLTKCFMSPRAIGFPRDRRSEPHLQHMDVDITNPGILGWKSYETVGYVMVNNQAIKELTDYMYEQGD